MAESSFGILLRCSLALLAILVSVALLRTFSVKPPQLVEICDWTKDHYIAISPEIISRFSNVIKIRTISVQDNRIDLDTMARMRDFIFRSFPTIHNSPLVSKEVVNNCSLLYTVKGSEKNLRPYFLAAHLDVVPADPDTWYHPPFEGVVQEGFVYGRGAIDDKHAVMGILEALEYLLKTGYQPRRSFYVGFGCDEEVCGGQGAGRIAELMKDRNVNLSFLLDEGLMITKDIVRIVDKPVALIGVAEKGYLTVEVSVRGKSGHSSIPPPTSSIGILAKAISKLEENPMENLFGKGVERTMLEELASYASFPLKLVLSNLWLFSPIVARVMSANPLMNPIIRTTTAVTMLKGGIKDNVIPAEASAIINHRIHPLQRIDQVMRHNKKVINDNRVNLKIVQGHEPSPISPFTDATFGYQVIRNATLKIFPDVVVVPGVLVATTDCKWYLNLTDQIYRFTPVLITPNDTSRYHGDNERISIKNYEQVINFYHHVIINADGDDIHLMKNLKTEL